jgi:hypothetical protein
MTQKEHLKKIKAKCQKLLKIAKNRTTGKWNVIYKERTTGSYSLSTTYIPYIVAGGSNLAEGWESDEKDAYDFEFIASCTGPAEAGWRATILCVAMILDQLDSMDVFVRNSAKTDAATIIAAWPEEIL